MCQPIKMKRLSTTTTEKCPGLRFLMETQGNQIFNNYFRIKALNEAFNVTSYPTIIFVEAKGGNYEIVLLDGTSLIQRCHGIFVNEILAEVYDPNKGFHKDGPEWKRYGQI